MKHPLIRSRRMRYGGMTVYLTVTLIAALVLLNAIFSLLANYYSWYIDMTPDKLYSVSDLCHELLSDAIEDAEEQSGKRVKAEIIFCEDYREYEKGEVGHYIYNTAHELELAYPDNITVSWFDCWVEKSRAEELGVTASTNVVLKLDNGEKRVFNQKEFFAFETGNTTSPLGYDGDRVFATTLTSLINGDRPTAVLTTNHEELFFDNALMYALRDAGYNITFLDLYYKDIPEDCELLVCYNPNNDFVVSSSVSETSEIDKLEAYLARGGNMMVFLSASSPELPALEGLLATWGVSIGRTYDKQTGHPYNAIVKDTSVSLTADGFTIYGDYVTEGEGATVTAALREANYTPRVVFGDATVLLPAQGYTAQGTSTYTNGTRTRSDVFVGSDRAKAWACGAELEGYDDLPLMTMTTDSASGARVMVCGSIELAGETYLKSPVFGNNDVLLSVMKDMGLDDVLIGLRYKPFATDTIASITTAQMLRWTLGLTLTPAILILGVATFVLVRRKYS
jgi:hypothetical protein